MTTPLKNLNKHLTTNKGTYQKAMVGKVNMISAAFKYRNNLTTLTNPQGGEINNKVDVVAVRTRNEISATNHNEQPTRHTVTPFQSSETPSRYLSNREWVALVRRCLNTNGVLVSKPKLQSKSTKSMADLLGKLLHSRLKQHLHQ